MTSTLVGASGRVYVRDKLLRSHPRNSQLNIYLANCEGRSFVLKLVSESIFKYSVTIKQHFPDNSQLRTHVDILIYKYFTYDLLRLVQKNLNLSLKARKSILREIVLCNWKAKSFLMLELVMLYSAAQRRKLEKVLGSLQMYSLIDFFPVPPGLIACVNDERWGAILTELSEATAEDPSMRFNQWTENTFPNLNTKTKRVIIIITKLDPQDRATISKVLKDPWWRNNDIRGVSRG
ncbi:hypothetical protein DPV78_000149 [Talaromyces pinophilus]|nr:hypothetical protein DPV78_000149 [Talaromyces pinophilus]